MQCGSLHDDDIVGRIGVVVAAIAAAVNAAPDGAISDGDGSVFDDGTQLASAIDIALDNGVFAINFDMGALHPRHSGPHCIKRAVQKGERTHTAAIHIAAQIIFDVMEFRLVIVANHTTVDGNIGMTVSALVVVRLHLTVKRLIGVPEFGTHRGVTSATIHGAKDCAASDGQVGVATHVTCREGFAREPAA